MPRVALTAAIVLLVTGTLAHGVVTGRWTRGASQDLTMPALPMQIGEWSGKDEKSDLEGDPNLKNITRRYTNTRKTRSYTISLTLGPAGLTAQHTPEYCYPGSGYQSAEAIRPFSPAGSEATFRTTVFRKELPGGNDSLRIFWAWTNDGKWTSPKVPEFAFLGRSSLYKLYVVASVNNLQPEDDAEFQSFMTSLLATLDKSLFVSPQS